MASLYKISCFMKVNHIEHSWYSIYHSDLEMLYTLSWSRPEVKGSAYLEVGELRGFKNPSSILNHLLHFNNVTGLHCVSCQYKTLVLCNTSPPPNYLFSNSSTGLLIQSLCLVVDINDKNA